jgi:membrane protease YdiL (CAAX protease family)
VVRRIAARVRAVLSLRDTAIGAGAPRPVAIVLAAAAVAVAAYDVFALDYDDFLHPVRRSVPALIVVAALAAALAGRRAIGVRAAPAPSGWFWIKGTLGVTAVFAVIVGGSFAIYVAQHGLAWPRDQPVPDVDAAYLRGALIEAPLVEELIYRWALVTALAAAGLRWTAVVISGALFGYLHVRYGVAAPNNVAAGFVFAWMYLRSAHIGMPVVFHSVGNLAVAALNVAAYRLIA